MSDGLDESKGRVDVLETAIQFAELLRADPQGIDRTELERGRRLLSLFQDSNYTDGFQGLRLLKTRLIHDAIRDLSDRARILSGSYFGVFFLNGKLVQGTHEYGAETKGSLVYKIALKDVAGFQRWRKGESTELSAEDLHAGIYQLTVELSRL